MSDSISNDALDARGLELDSRALNGIRHVLVRLAPGPSPASAELEVFFHNARHLSGPGGLLALGLAGWNVSGGQRIPAGAGPGEVQVSAVAAGSGATSLKLTVTPVGDYSTYLLSLADSQLVPGQARWDPFFGSLGFKFRPGCFFADCHCQADVVSQPEDSPAIDYLAKDYDSFRHVLIAAMSARVPGWQVSSEADLDQTLLSLIAAAGDELSDYQDRVMNEAWLVTARKRVSLARHARLMDYHIHQGQQSTTWLALHVDGAVAPQGFHLGIDDETKRLPVASEPDELMVRTGRVLEPGEADVHFSSRECHLPASKRSYFHPLLNDLRIHSWGGARPELPVGATTADLAVGAAGGLKVSADAVDQLIRDGKFRRLLFQEHLNPMTGREPGRNTSRRQMVDLTGSKVIHDPVANRWLVRITWRREDALRACYHLVVGPGAPVSERVSLAHGNLVAVNQGTPVKVHFYDGSTKPELGSVLSRTDSAWEKHRYYQRTERWGTLCPLPTELGPLAYVPSARGGEAAPRSTLRPLDPRAAADATASPILPALLVTPANSAGEIAQVCVEVPGAGAEVWEEKSTLVYSDGDVDTGSHYLVETDENRRSTLRFGNDTNGRDLPEGAIVHARYQTGGGAFGNVGFDSLVHAPLRRDNVALPPAWKAVWPSVLLPGGVAAVTAPIVRTWNPFDVTDGLDPQPVEKIIRDVPEAYRARQLRAVTLGDYVRRAEEVDGVSRAMARYFWTGSWRTVRIVIDPEADASTISGGLQPVLRRRVFDHLEAVRLMGEDLEIRAPRYVPVEIIVVVCVSPDVWPEDVRWVLQQEFSTGWTDRGGRAFFHPDEWTFGQALHRSQIEGRVHQVPGVEHLIRVEMRRFNAVTPGDGQAESLAVGVEEIIQVLNDPDSRERGSIEFQLQGGRQA